MSNGQSSAGRAVVSVLLYVAARLVLVIALTAVIYGAGRGLGVHEFPLIVALLFALVIAMPLGMWLFAPLRRRATAGIDAGLPPATGAGAGAEAVGGGTRRRVSG